MMTTDRQDAMLHYGRALVRKRRGVDKKGLALAMIFLIGVSLWAGWRREQMTEPVISWDERPNLSAEMGIRPGANSVLEEEAAQSVQSSVRLTGELYDPRQGR